MYTKATVAITAVLAIAASSAIALRAVIAQDQNVAVQSRNANVEVLARGPVHEAFAEPVTLQGFDPLVIDAAPPEPIEELPPEQKLEGDNVQWIPGYWAWEDDRQDFIWISGVWRECPPGQKWVPGFWSDNEGRWYWSPGFWVSEEMEEIEYLPEPPETLEEGPQVEAPSEDHVWVPGVWQYHEARYAWRPGYWTAVQPGWVWVPARYMWCPSGYVFVDGYWDYALARRGLLFAPVYYHQPIYRLPDYYYTPSVVISTDILTVHLFARPQYSHYYFGDYYAPRYREIGIEPWLMFPRIRGYYDPLFHYYSWYHARRGHDWQVMVRDRYEFFSRHEDYRPAHTYVGLQRQRFAPIRTGDVNIQNNIQNIVLQQNNLVVNFNQYIQNFEQNVRIDEDGGDRRDRMRFARLAPEERRNYFAHAREIRGFQQRRSEIESEPQITDRSQRSEFAREERQQRRALRLTDYQTRQPRQRRLGRERDIRRDVPPTPELTAGIQRGEDRRRTEDRRPEVDADDRQERLGEALGRSDRTRDEDGRRRGAIGRQDRFQEPDVGQNVDPRDRNIEPSPRSRDRITDRGLGIAGATPPEARIAPDGTEMEDTVDRPIEESAPRVRRFGRDQALTDFVETDDAARLGPTFPQRSGRDDLRQRRDDDGRLLSEDQQRTLDQLRQLRRGEDRAGEMPIDSAGRSFGRSFDDRNVSPPESRDLRGQRGDRSQPLDRNRQFEAQRDLLRQRDTGRDPIRTPALAPDAQRRANQTPQQEFQRGRTRPDRAADRLGPSRENVERFLNERRDATSQRDIDRSGQLRTREPFGGRQFGQRGSDVVTPGTDRTPGRMVPGFQGDTIGRRSRFESFTEQQERRDTPDLGRQRLPSRDIEPRWGQREGQPWSEGRTRSFGGTLEQRNFAPEQSDLDGGRQFRSGARSIPFGPGRDDSERQPPPRVRSDGARTFLRQRERTPLSPGREDRVFRGGAAAEAWSTTSPDQRRRERVQREEEDDD